MYSNLKVLSTILNIITIILLCITGLNDLYSTEDVSSVWPYVLGILFCIINILAIDEN